MRFRWVLGICVVLVIAAVASMSRRDAERPSRSFCLTLGEVEERLDEVEAVTTRTHGQTDADLQTLRGVLGLVWTDEVASKGPNGTEEDALLVMRAIRGAVTADDPAPLRTPEVRAAAERLGPEAAAACEGRGT